jgi:hypothetical protein
MVIRAMVYTLTVVVAIGVSAQAQDDASAKLGEASKKTAEWKSYKFTSETKTEGGQGGGNRPSGPSEGTFEKDKGLHVKMGDLEAVKVGDKVATLRDGNWSLAGNNQGQPGQGQGQGGQGGQGRRRGMGGPSTEAPHLALADLEKKFSKVTSSTEGDATVFSGDLTSGGAADLMGGMVRRFAQNGETKGTAKITVNKDGQIVKVEVNGSVTGKVRDRDINLTITRTITFSDIDTATVTIPDGAKKVLEQP